MCVPTACTGHLYMHVCNIITFCGKRSKSVGISRAMHSTLFVAYAASIVKIHPKQVAPPHIGTSSLFSCFAGGLLDTRYRTDRRGQHSLSHYLYRTLTPRFSRHVPFCHSIRYDVTCAVAVTRQPRASGWIVPRPWLRGHSKRRGLRVVPVSGRARVRKRHPIAGRQWLRRWPSAALAISHATPVQRRLRRPSSQHRRHPRVEGGRRRCFERRRQRGFKCSSDRRHHDGARVARSPIITVTGSFGVESRRRCLDVWH